MAALRPMAIDVKPMEEYRLLVTFDNLERRVFDVAPYIKGTWFGKLKDVKIFREVHIGGLSIEWPDGQDICPDRLYEDSIPLDIWDPDFTKVTPAEAAALDAEAAALDAAEAEIVRGETVSDSEIDWDAE